MRAVSTGIASTWTFGQADSWRLDAAALIDSIAATRRQHEGFRLSTRWNARASRQRAALGQAEEALRPGERNRGATTPDQEDADGGAQDLACRLWVRRASTAKSISRQLVHR